MTKKELINYLQKQLKKVKAPDFELEIWQEAVTDVLDDALGNGNSYSRKVRGLEYDITVSYDELYPQRVRDEKGSRHKFYTVLQEIIDRISVMDEDKLGKDDAVKGEQTLEAVQDALKNYLTGKQYDELKQAIAKGEVDREEVLDLVRRLDIEVTQTILIDILLSKEVWAG